jgi:UDP:flavonoid glycosyltransferase YjiC (YdhE family)
MSAFDAAIGAAGYNTVNELLHFGVPAVLIPRERGLDDQFRRAQQARAAGAALVSSLDRTSIEQTLRMLAADDALRAQMAASAATACENSGAALAAHEILGLL